MLILISICPTPIELSKFISKIIFFVWNIAKCLLSKSYGDFTLCLVLTQLNFSLYCIFLSLLIPFGGLFLWAKFSTKIQKKKLNIFNISHPPLQIRRNRQLVWPADFPSLSIIFKWLDYKYIIQHILSPPTCYVNAEPYWGKSSTFSAWI